MEFTFVNTLRIFMRNQIIFIEQNTLIKYNNEFKSPKLENERPVEHIHLQHHLLEARSNQNS